MYAGSATERIVSSHVPAPGRPVTSTTDGCQRNFASTGTSFALSPGWWIQNEITLRWNDDVCAHSLYGSTTPVFTQWSYTSCGDGGNDAGCGTWSIHCPLLSVAYVLTLFAFQSARESVVTAQQPTSAFVRTTHGITRTAAPASTAADASTVVRERPARHSRYADHDERQRLEAHVAEDRDPQHGAERERAPPAEPLRRPQGQEDRRGREEVVEDLAVHVHVVPDEVRMERDREAGEQPDRRRQPAPADLPDDRASSPTATTICASPTTTQWRPKIQ